MPDLPSEVQCLIASHLDRRSAFALTLVCKAWRDAGEARLYEHVDLTVEGIPMLDNGMLYIDTLESGTHLDWTPGHQLWPATDTTGSSSQFAIPPYSTYPDERDRLFHKAISERCDALQRALCARTQRQAYIKELRLPPIGGTQENDYLGLRLYDILIKCAPRLQTLYIARAPYSFNYGDFSLPGLRVRDGYNFFGRFVSEYASGRPILLPHLTTFVLHLSRSCIQLVPDILAVLHSGSVALRVLSLDFTQLRYSLNIHDDWARAWRGHASTTFGLRTIELVGLRGKDETSLVLGIAERSRNLERLNCSGSVGDPEELDMFPALSNLALLERMELPMTDFSSFTDRDGRRWPGHGSKLTVDLKFPVKELVVRNGEADELSELCCDLPFYLKAPSVQRLTLVTKSRRSRSKPGHIPVRSGTTFDACSVTHYADEFLLSHWSDLLSEMPALDTVMVYSHPELRSYYRPSESDPRRLTSSEHDFVVAPDRWEAEHHRGVILRQYRHPIDPDASFFHQRVLSRVYHTYLSRPHIGQQRHWRDSARYYGIMLPGDVLQRVYEAAGSELEWLSPGRDCSLNDAAWKILQDWRTQVEDMEHRSALSLNRWWSGPPKRRYDEPVTVSQLQAAGYGEVPSDAPGSSVVDRDDGSTGSLSSRPSSERLFGPKDNRDPDRIEEGGDREPGDGESGNHAGSPIVAAGMTSDKADGDSSTASGDDDSADGREVEIALWADQHFQQGAASTNPDQYLGEYEGDMYAGRYGPGLGY